MMRIFAMALALLAILFCLGGCGRTRIVHCDRCGSEITLSADDKIQEDWIVFCKTCEESLFHDDPVVSPGN